MAHSFDYVFFSGSKQLLDEVIYSRDLHTPWSAEDEVTNKKIVEEYLQFRHDKAQEAIKG
jgi:hypothetical protein